MARMNCPEKQALQSRCTAAWEAYEAAIKRAGLPASRSESPIKSSLSTLTKVYFGIDPENGTPVMPAYSTALFLRREHQRISAELSSHLCRHRC